MAHKQELFLPEPLHGGHPEIEKQRKIAGHEAWVQATKEQRAAEEHMERQLMLSMDMGKQALAEVVEFPHKPQEVEVTQQERTAA